MSQSKDLSSNALSQRYEKLLTDEKHCDCSFLLGVRNYRFRCHRIILAAASPVFEAMFYGPMKYSGNEETIPDIEIQDISENIFRHLILYIYKGYVDLRTFTLDETIEMYYGAEKYLLTDLIKKCLEALALKLRFDNILSTLELSVCLDLNNLLTICLNFFTRCCLGNDQFMTYLNQNHNYCISKECMEMIINHWHQFGQTQSQTKCLLKFICHWSHEISIEEDNCSNNENLTTPNLDFLEPKIMAQLKDAWNKITKLDIIHSGNMNSTISIQRAFYRACRPFTVNTQCFEWSALIKCDKFIALHGIIIYSRQSPTDWDLLRTNCPMRATTSYVEENLLIEVKSVLPSTANIHNPNPVTFKWNHRIINQPATYNCFLNIKWSDIVILSPDVQYEIRLTWEPLLSSGVEYTTGVLEANVNGIHFEDCDLHNGSMLKGLHIAKLV